MDHRTQVLLSEGCNPIRRIHARAHDDCHSMSCLCILAPRCVLSCLKDIHFVLPNILEYVKIHVETYCGQNKYVNLRNKTLFLRSRKNMICSSNKLQKLCLNNSYFAISVARVVFQVVLNSSITFW